MTTDARRKVGRLTGWTIALALAAGAGCGSATSVAVSGGSPDAGGGAGGRTAIRSVGNTHRGFVSAGHLLKSNHFQMISALGPPTITVGSSSSAHAQLRSGLVPNMSE